MEKKILCGVSSVAAALFVGAAVHTLTGNAEAGLQFSSATLVALLVLVFK